MLGGHLSSRHDGLKVSCSNGPFLGLSPCLNAFAGHEGWVRLQPIRCSGLVGNGAEDWLLSARQEGLQGLSEVLGDSESRAGSGVWAPRKGRWATMGCRPVIEN